MSMKALVVLNPAAGGQAQESVCKALASDFEAARIRYVIHETSAEEKIAETVRARLQDGFDIVVAVGGDGTVSAVLDALVGSDASLGIVPTGTGNMIARELGIPLEIDDAVALIAGTPRSRRIDAMRLGEQVFALGISAGVSAAVMGDTTSPNKKRFGRIAYLWSVVPKIFTLRPRRVVVTVDDVEHACRTIEVAIMNGGELTKSLPRVGPEIRIDDGYLDVIILSVNAFRDYVHYLLDIILGRPVDLPADVHRAERSVCIRSRVRLPIQADGDVIGTTPIEVEFLRGAVAVLVPEEDMSTTELE
jgi:diacylglycerol kinase (ATP)